MTFAAVGAMVYTSSSLASYTASLNPTAVNNFFMVALQSDSNTIFCSSISGGNCTWIEFVPKYLGTNQNYYQQIFLGTATGTGAVNATITMTGAAFSTFGAQQFSRTVGAPILDKRINVDAVSINTFPAITPAAAGELYWAHAYDSGTAAAGSTPGYVYYSDGNADGTCYNVNCTAAAQAPVWGDTSTRMGIIVLVMESGGAPASILPQQTKHRFPATFTRIAGRKGNAVYR